MNITNWRCGHTRDITLKNQRVRYLFDDFRPQGFGDGFSLNKPWQRSAAAVWMLAFFQTAALSSKALWFDCRASLAIRYLLSWQACAAAGVSRFGPVPAS